MSSLVNAFTRSFIDQNASDGCKKNRKQIEIKYLYSLSFGESAKGK